MKVTYLVLDYLGGDDIAPGTRPETASKANGVDVMGSLNLMFGGLFGLNSLTINVIFALKPLGMKGPLQFFLREAYVFEVDGSSVGYVTQIQNLNLGDPDKTLSYGEITALTDDKRAFCLYRRDVQDTVCRPWFRFDADFEVVEHPNISPDALKNAYA